MTPLSNHFFLRNSCIANSFDSPNDERTVRIVRDNLRKLRNYTSEFECINHAIKQIPDNEVLGLNAIEHLKNFHHRLTVKAIYPSSVTCVQAVEELEQQLNEYAASKGKEFASIKDGTDRALRMYGITEEERLGLENGIGIARFYDLFGTIGKNLQEGNLISKANDSITKTTETYKLELDKLFNNQEFMIKYMNGDIEALNKVNDLNKKISGV